MKSIEKSLNSDENIPFPISHGLYLPDDTQSSSSVGDPHTALNSLSTKARLEPSEETVGKTPDTLNTSTSLYAYFFYIIFFNE